MTKFTEAFDLIKDDGEMKEIASEIEKNVYKLLYEQQDTNQLLREMLKTLNSISQHGVGP